MADIQFAVEDRRKRGYFTVDNVLLDVYGAQLGPHGIAVYVALARFANQDQECWPSHSTIAERTGMSRRQVLREIAKLEQLEIVSVTKRATGNGIKTSHLYVLLDIIVRCDTQSQSDVTHSHKGSDSQSHKQSLIKKGSNLSNKKKGKGSYLPENYPDL